MRIGLVGCVKSKQSSGAPACELYTSALFLGRRAYVERTCDRWFVLSALHGLVAPDSYLEPYDKTLAKAPIHERRRWSNEVLSAITREVRDLRDATFEIHAGNAYCGFGLIEGLKKSGAHIDLPVKGLSLGRQLRFYAQAS